MPPLDRLLPGHFNYVHAVLIRLAVTPEHWRDDLAQEVLIRAHRSRNSPLDVRALLFGITRHVVLSWRARRRAEHAVAVLSPGPEPFTERNAEDVLEHCEELHAIQSAIDALPVLLREVFQRTQIEQMTMAQAVSDLGIPVNTGYTRLHLARAHFLESLQRPLAPGRKKPGG